MSSVVEREDLVLHSWKKALREQERDQRDADTLDQIRAINRNVARLHTAALQVSLIELDKNGPAIESAYEAAKQAKTDVETAYNNEKQLTERIRSVGKLADNIGTLIEKAAGPAAASEDG